MLEQGGRSADTLKTTVCQQDSSDFQYGCDISIGWIIAVYASDYLIFRGGISEREFFGG